MDKTPSSTIKVNLPVGILQNSTDEAARIGISLQDFIRLLLGTYFSRSRSITAISRDAILLDRGRREFATGLYTQVDSDQEIEDHLQKL